MQVQDRRRQYLTAWLLLHMVLDLVAVEVTVDVVVPSVQCLWRAPMGHASLLRVRGFSSVRLLPVTLHLVDCIDWLAGSLPLDLGWHLAPRDHSNAISVSVEDGDVCRGGNHSRLPGLPASEVCHALRMLDSCLRRSRRHVSPICMLVLSVVERSCRENLMLFVQLLLLIRSFIGALDVDLRGRRWHERLFRRLVPALIFLNRRAQVIGVAPYFTGLVLLEVLVELVGGLHEHLSIFFATGLCRSFIVFLHRQDGGKRLKPSGNRG